MSKHIHWLLDIEDGSFDAVTKSNMASQRLRAGCMMKRAYTNSAIVTAGKIIGPDADHLIVGKIGTFGMQAKQAQWIESIRTHRRHGKFVTLDFTDNHLDTETEMTSFYTEALELADSVVCSSDHLAAAVGMRFKGPIHAIPDPIEISPIPPKTTAFWPRTILWFGHSSNLPYLVNFLPFLQAQVPIRLIILSDAEGLRALERSTVPKPENLLIELRTWSNDSMISAGAESDCCIIPSDPRDPRKAGVSSNRLLTALALGLPTIASELASYQPFAEYFNPINSNDSINVMIDPSSYSKQVLRAQEEILQQYSTQAVGEQWFNTIISGNTTSFSER